MRPYLVIAVVIVLIVLFAGKMFLYPSPAAQAQSPPGATGEIDVFRMHLEHPNIRQLPERTVKEPF